jgi:hypothetical protein
MLWHKLFLQEQSGARRHYRWARVRQQLMQKPLLESLEDRTLPSFLPPISYPVGDYVVGVATGDLRGDGKVDIVTVNNDSQTVSVLLGNGDGTFQPAVNYDARPDPFGLALGHFHDPRVLDLVVTHKSAGGVSVWLGNGDGTFQAPVFYDFGLPIFPFHVAVGDLTGNGHVDIVTANSIGNFRGNVSVLLGNGDGTFQAPTSYPLDFDGSLPTSLALGDFNGDGAPDLAVTSFRGLSVLLGNGDGTFQAAQRISSQDWDSIAVGDLRNNGHQDLVVGSGLAVFLGNGDGTFQAPEFYRSAASFVGLGDFNGDGTLDIATSGGIPAAGSVLLGNGDGTFQLPLDFPIGPDIGRLAVGDFNGDGFPDLAIANQESSSVSVVLNAADWSGGDRGPGAESPAPGKMLPRANNPVDFALSVRSLTV